MVTMLTWLSGAISRRLGRTCRFLRRKMAMSRKMTALREEMEFMYECILKLTRFG